MKIAGLQKLTLLDYPEKTACTVFTWGCNLRCPFCHNAPLVVTPPERLIDPEEIYAFLRKRRGILDGVCVTGGEPLLQDDLLGFLRPIKEMGFLIKLDTNGTLPEKLTEAADSGLIDMVAMDVKNCPEKYAVTAGAQRPCVEAVNRSVRFLLRGGVPYEFRTTVVENYHTEADMESIARWLAGAEHYYLQQFEDSGALIESGLRGCSERTMRRYLEIVRERIPTAALRGISS